MDLFSDSIDDMELDIIKGKIRDVYNKLLTEYYKKEYPGYLEEDLNAFIESNAMEFEGASEEESEINLLMEELDALLDDGEELSPVDSSGKAPEYDGTELKAKSKESTTAPEGKYSGDILGGMMTPSDNNVKIKTSKVEDPTGQSKTSKTHERPNIVADESVKAILDKYRAELMAWVNKRNKEFGVRL
jgi:hypothetical protein